MTPLIPPDFTVNNHTNNVNVVTFVTGKHMSPEGRIF